MRRTIVGHLIFNQQVYSIDTNGNGGRSPYFSFIRGRIRGWFVSSLNPPPYQSHQ